MSRRDGRRLGSRMLIRAGRSFGRWPTAQPRPIAEPLSATAHRSAIARLGSAPVRFRDGWRRRTAHGSTDGSNLSDPVPCGGVVLPSVNPEAEQRYARRMKWAYDRAGAWCTDRLVGVEELGGVGERPFLAPGC